MHIMKVPTCIGVQSHLFVFDWPVQCSLKLESDTIISIFFFLIGHLGTTTLEGLYRVLTAEKILDKCSYLLYRCIIIQGSCYSIIGKPCFSTGYWVTGP